jgi:hypothetical protein
MKEATASGTYSSNRRDFGGATSWKAAIWEIRFKRGVDGRKK